MDYGQTGLEETIKSFPSAMITGVGTYDDAYKINIAEKDGEKIGFLGLTHKEFGCVDIDSCEGLGTAMLTSPKVPVAIINAKTKVDRLYLLIHAGVEYMDAPLPEWREQYQSFIDLGVDGIFASHPHVPQGWEIYHGKPIFYSLGNFAFEKTKNPSQDKRWYQSICAVLDTENESVMAYSLYYNNVTKTIDIAKPDEQIDLAYLNALLSPGRYPEYISKALTGLIPTYNYLMKIGGALPYPLKERIKNRIKKCIGQNSTEPNPVHLMNLFQCESHRWAMMRLIKDKLDK